MNHITGNEVVPIPLNAFVVHFRKFQIRRSLRTAMAANIATWLLVFPSCLVTTFAPVPVWVSLPLLVIIAIWAYRVSPNYVARAEAVYVSSDGTVNIPAYQLHRTSDTRIDNLISVIGILLINLLGATGAFFGAPVFPILCVNALQLVPALIILTSDVNRETVLKQIGKDETDGSDIKLIY